MKKLKIIQYSVDRFTWRGIFSDECISMGDEWRPWRSFWPLNMQWDNVHVAKGIVSTALVISICAIFYIANCNIYKFWYTSDVVKPDKISVDKLNVSDGHTNKTLVKRYSRAQESSTCQSRTIYTTDCYAHLHTAGTQAARDGQVPEVQAAISPRGCTNTAYGPFVDGRSIRN